MRKKELDFLALQEARKLAERLREGEAFRAHLQARQRLVLPAFAVFSLVAFACAAATAVFFADLSSWLTLPGFLLAPAVLVGSLYTMALVFLGWLERRALALALGHAPRGAMSELAKLPWPLVAAMLGVPLVLLAAVWPLLALPLAAATAMVPFLYVRLDRTPRSRLTRQRAAV